MDDDFGSGLVIGLFGGLLIVLIVFVIVEFAPAINMEYEDILADKVCELSTGTKAERWEGKVLICSREEVIPIEENPYVIDLGGDGE